MAILYSTRHDNATLNTQHIGSSDSNCRLMNVRINDSNLIRSSGEKILATRLQTVGESPNILVTPVHSTRPNCDPFYMNSYVPSRAD